MGFLILFISSIFIEGNPLEQLYPFDYNGIITAFHAGIFVSLIGHGGLFYLYKHYPVSILLPFYSLFPIFGILLTFFIFFEIPGLYEIFGGMIIMEITDNHLELIMEDIEKEFGRKLMRKYRHKKDKDQLKKGSE